MGRPDHPLPRNHHFGTELRLRAARADPRTRRAGPLRPVQLACRDQRRRTHRRPRRTPPGRGRCTIRIAAGSDHLRLTGWPKPPSRHLRQLPSHQRGPDLPAAICTNALRDARRRTDARRVVSVGLPVAGMEIRVVDDTANRTRRDTSARSRFAARRCRLAISPKTVGSTGPSPGRLAVDRRPRLLRRTDGKLYVCGRAKDVIVIAGNNVYPTDIERAACAVPGVRAGNAVAVRIDAGDVPRGLRRPRRVEARRRSRRGRTHSRRNRPSGQPGRWTQRTRGTGAASGQRPQDGLGQVATRARQPNCSPDRRPNLDYPRGARA